MPTDRRDESFEPICLKERGVCRWTARRLGTIGHERQVAAIASHLFDLTAPLHNLTGSHRKLLRLGSLVHDVGRWASKADHPARGARLVLDDDTLPLTAAERRALAYLTLYHKGRVPPVGADEVLSPKDDREPLRLLLAMLRTADALDSRSLESPRLVFALTPRGGSGSGLRLRVTCYLEEDSAKARKVFRRRRGKFRLLEELLGLEVDVQTRLAHALRLVA